MTEPDRTLLERPRELNGFLSDSFGLYRRHFWTFLAMAVVVVVPANAVVVGFGLGEFTGGYDSTPEPAAAIVPQLVQLLVVGPLLAVMALYALLDVAEGRKPRLGRSIQSGLDAFTPVFWPVLLAVLCEIGTLVTIVVPLVLIVRWYLVPQLVVLEKARGPQALRASWELTRGFAWRAASMIFVVQLLLVLGVSLIATPLDALAESADSEALRLGAITLGETLLAPPLAIFATLLYFDLKSRQAALAR